MTKADIYCKIELIKDKNTGKMTVTAHLNPEAPNVTVDEHTISWTPTFEEQHFLMEAISLLKKQQDQPLVTFTKKQQEPFQQKENKRPDTIESINETIDNLPIASRNQQHFSKTSETIEGIIQQNSKEK